MNSKFSYIYQFRITLERVEPLIWRQIQVPETYTFWDLHVAIQDAMGWTDSHLHQFEVKHPKTKAFLMMGIPEDYFGDSFDYNMILPGWEYNLRDYFSAENPSVRYEYDFGDCWSHKIELEQILFKTEKCKYPICLAGSRSCPPEDCGGTSGYANLLDALSHPKHKEYKHLKTWAGKNFDPEKFDAEKVRFMNPKTRFDKLLES